MTFNILHIILLAILFVCFVIQMIYWWIYLAKLYYKQQEAVQQKEYTHLPVSVIVYVEYFDGDLERNLTAILDQDYPSFEVIAIDDNLPEECVDILKRLAHQYEHFYYTQIPDRTRNLSRKKLGLSLGIKAAKYDTLLFTESDSRPISRDWIKTMAACFGENQSVVLGFSVLGKQKGLKMQYLAFDYFYTNLRIICKAIEGRPYGANGRNMGYGKFHFTNQKGFSKYQFLRPGADDLFINEVAENKNINVDVSLKGLIKTGWNDLLSWQIWKTERMATKRYYSKRSRLFWQMESLSRLLFYALGVYLIAACLFSIFIPIAVLVMYLIRLASQLFVINKTASKLKSARYYLQLPLFDLLQLFVDPYYYLKGIIQRKKDYTWNLGQ